MTNDKKLQKLKLCIRSGGDEYCDVVEDLAAGYPTVVGRTVFDYVAVLQADLGKLAAVLEKGELSAVKRRQCLVGVVALTGLLLAIDETKRGSNKIEKEMAVVHENKKQMQTKRG